MENGKKRKPLPKHWYMIYEDECVLCGRGDIWRERKYGERPEKWEDRHKYEQYACDSHFM